MQRKFVQDSENPKFGKKDWKIPRAGRIIRLSACSDAWKRPAVYAHDLLSMSESVTGCGRTDLCLYLGAVTWDVCSVYKELLLNMEFQGSRRYSVNHKTLEIILGHLQGLLTPEEPQE